MSLNEIISKYTSTEYTANQANEQLKLIGSAVRLVDGKNTITDEENAESIIGDNVTDVNGFGLLDTGTVTLDKVRVKNGVLVDCDCGETYAVCTICGKSYVVVGKDLVK